MNADAARTIDSLDELKRLVILLRYESELTWPEIAAVLDLTEEKVRGAHDAVVARMRRPRRAK